MMIGFGTLLSLFRTLVVATNIVMSKVSARVHLLILIGCIM